MTQNERRLYLIEYLLAEQEAAQGTRFLRQGGGGARGGAAAQIPSDEEGQRRLLRALFNVRPPVEAGAEFLRVQDEYLTERKNEKGVVRLAGGAELALWRGDITRLEVDAIVNAANSTLTGCYSPNHGCIDNCIHTFAGVQLRGECARIIARQGHEEPTGCAKITGAYNLPSRHVIHTVGPVVSGVLTPQHCAFLQSCYRSCLELAAENALGSIAFCCISTGVFSFPNKKAAEIAVKTVRDFKAETNSKMRVVFNVFGEKDERIYEELLCKQNF